MHQGSTQVLGCTEQKTWSLSLQSSGFNQVNEINQHSRGPSVIAEKDVQRTLKELEEGAPNPDWKQAAKASWTRWALNGVLKNERENQAGK